MGIEDRDYYRDDPRPAPSGAAVGQMRFWRVATWLIVINVAVFLADGLLASRGLGYFHVVAPVDGAWVEATPAQRAVPPNATVAAGARVTTMGPLERWGYFSFTTAIQQFQAWRWITFQFLHAGIGHLFGNMLGLYFFGPMIEDYLGRRRFLAFYLLSGMAGPLVYLVFALTGVLQTLPFTPLVGASAGIFGILIAAAQVAPRTTVMLMFPPIPMQLRTLAWGLLALAAFTVFTNGRNAGGEAAHLGGAALGWLLIRHPNWLAWAEKLGPASRRLPGGATMRYHSWR